MVMKDYIVIVNFFSSEVLKSCLESIRCLVNADKLNVIVVDNSVNQEEYNRLKELQIIENELGHLFLHLIYSDSNYGLASGINQGIRHARKIDGSENFYIWILNPDTKVLPNSLIKLKEKFDENMHSIAGSIVFDYSNSHIQVYCGKLDLRYGHLSVSTRKVEQNKDVIIYPNGASLYTCYRNIMKLDYFDTDYFLYYEELDFVFKGMKFNLQPLVVEESKVLHIQGFSTKNKLGGKKNLILFKLQVQNLKLFFKKHLPNRMFSFTVGMIIQLMKQLVRFQLKKTLITLRVLWS